jgi:hypothetical protein
MDPALEGQIETAFDYRGHVTVALKDKTSIEGYLFNRQFSDPKRNAQGFIEMILKNKDEQRRIAIDDILSVSLTGEDCAAGKSYADYLAKQKAETAK